jgi:hypothetical protein
LPNANIEAHRIENHSVVCHDSLIKKEAAPNAQQLLFVKLEGLHGNLMPGPDCQNRQKAVSLILDALPVLIG